jgi:hypothetical protein
MQEHAVPLGIGGLSVQPGTHICALFRGSQERTDLMFPFVEEGLRSGDKCMCAFDSADLRSLQSEVDGQLGGAAPVGQLDVALSHDFYTAQGEFSPDRAIDDWDAWVQSALSGGGFSFARAAGEMTWAVTQVIGMDNLIRYESALNRFVPRYPQVMMCLYDLDHFSGKALVDILRTHPKVLLGSTVLENLYYVAPDEILAAPS